MSVADILDEIRRTREAYRALKSMAVPPGETDEQMCRRSHESFELYKRLQKLEREKIVEEALAKRAAEAPPPTPAPSQGIERRCIRSDVHTTGRVAERRLEGYAATFGAEARIGDFVETIACGAFGASLDEAGRDILALVDHDPGRVLARTRSGNLELMEDRRGLKFNLRLPNTTAGNDVYALARSGDLGGMSFAFTVKKDRWEGERRTLEEVNLHEISIVSAWPAYPNTEVQARSALAQARSRPVQFARVALARRFLETL